MVEYEDQAIDVLKRSDIEYLYLPEKNKIIIEKNK
jgi:hypothetical protein